MLLKDRPIRWKLMAMILLTSGVVLLLTCAAFFAYEFLTFRQATIRQLSTLGEIIAANSTAPLAFDNHDDEELTLLAFKKCNIANEVFVAHDGAEALDFLFGTGTYAGRDLSVMPAVTLLDLKLPKG